MVECVKVSECMMMKVGITEVILQDVLAGRSVQGGHSWDRTLTNGRPPVTHLVCVLLPKSLTLVIFLEIYFRCFFVLVPLLDYILCSP